ncbi:hypothetical protein [Paraburkholderia humisilvae]|uniref:Uncharacterized protein n=1 Tax=Paraburkholderia humisilvae TaxID=627669 RepID=A0A6J5DJY3_9BURK|nr:hypothetical protein [Paraburkholderia humisilvae]CAB3753747.1 hypothetical protein LMG29542_02139 [Paraburkholderia humisilvae]
MKWCYPFPRKGGGEVTDPQVFYHALGQMTDGFFPLGVNGFPHGGVHFGAMSAACVDQSFAPSTEAVNGSALLLRLEQAVARLPAPGGNRPARGEDGREVVTAVKLQRAMDVPGLASELAHVVLRYESEWGGNMARWEAITPLMRNARVNWECELERVGKLQWWDQVKGKVEGFPDSPVVHHIHPVALVGNFRTACVPPEQGN